MSKNDPHARLRATVLWLGGALGLLALVWSVVLAVGGVTPVVVTDDDSGLRVGSLALATVVAPDDLEAGDVVTHQRADGAWVTQRLSDEPGAGGLTIAPPVQRVFLQVPLAGWLLKAAVSPGGAFAAGLLAAAVLFAAVSDPRLASGGRRLSPARQAATTALRRRHLLTVLVTWVGLLASLLGQGWGQVYL